MIENNKGLFSWLMDDSSGLKASLKFQIKQIEAELYHMLSIEKYKNTRSNGAVLLCENLIQQYNELLHLIAKNQKVCVAENCISEHNTLSCYYKIQAIKQAFHCQYSLNQEIEMIASLIFYYKNLCSLLQDNSCQLIRFKESESRHIFHHLVNAKTLNHWLTALVTLVQKEGQNLSLLKEKLGQLNDKNFLSMYEFFISSDWAALINNLFFFKIHPQNLYEHPIHPEKLISLKRRLSMLHSLVESIHQIVITTLQQRGFRADFDYLFHGEEMPDGVSIEPNEEYKNLIIVAVKEWGLAQLLTNTVITHNELKDLFRAYKFWFNPNRFIDAVMVLRSQLTGNIEQDEASDRFFLLQMILLYHHLTTTQCIDLYGYFSNKDTSYLMRMLLAAHQGTSIPGFPILMNDEKKTIRTIYLTIECVMNALRLELQNRHISTVAYRSNKDKKINPGDRNTQALKRVLDLYCDKKNEENPVLEELFSVIEGYGM